MLRLGERLWSVELEFIRQLARDLWEIIVIKERLREKEKVTTMHRRGIKVREQTKVIG